MLDKRKPLVGGFVLALHGDAQYIITEEIGRGGRCLVYDASYTDATGCRHQARIKECFPYDMEVWRKENGELEAADSCQEEFQMAKEKFCKAYRDNVVLKNTLGLMNSTMGTAGLYGKNNTFYSVMECVEGTDYRTESDEDLRSVLIRIRTLAKIIKKYHGQKLLHLDIKPENMLIIPETKEHMVLFDFDSLVSMEELKEGKEFRTAFSDGFAAPELVQGRRDRLCPATDIYSIGAVLFYKIFGRKPDAMDAAIGSEYRFDGIQYTVPKYRPEFYEKLDDFLHRMLSSSVSCRIKSIDEVLEGLEELLRLSDMPKSKKNRNLLALLACSVAVAGLLWHRNGGSYKTMGKYAMACVLEETFTIGRNTKPWEYMDICKKTAYNSHTGEIVEEYFEKEERVKKIYYREKGDIRMFISYKEGGENVILYEESGKVRESYQISYQYDGEGRIQKKQIARNMAGVEEGQGSSCAEIRYEYDETGMLVKEGIYNSDGNGKEIWYQYQYAEDGHLEKRYSLVRAGEKPEGDAEWEIDAELEYNIWGKEERYRARDGTEILYSYEYK